MKLDFILLNQFFYTYNTICFTDSNQSHPLGVSADHWYFVDLHSNNIAIGSNYQKLIVFRDLLNTDNRSYFFITSYDNVLFFIIGDDATFVTVLNRFYVLTRELEYPYLESIINILYQNVTRERPRQRRPAAGESQQLRCS